VLAVDPEKFEVMATIKVGKRPWGIAISPDGKKLYVANGPSDDVSVVDVAQEKETGRIKCGQSPWGVTVVSTHEYRRVSR
jgi:YVTN family beta-propeller protein